MFGAWTPLVAFVGTFLLLLGLKRWITERLAELSMRLVGDPDVALVVYFVVVLPGVLVHELSHWVVALILGVRVRQLSFGPVRKGRGKGVSLGSIRVGSVDRLRASLIGMAPLVGGSAVILLIGYLVLDVAALVEATTARGVEGLLVTLGELVQVPDFWLWLYLIFAVSNAMLPSESDMDSVRPVLIFLGIVTFVVVIVVGLPAIPVGAVAGVSAVAGYLATAFGLTLAVDLVFVVVIGLLTWLVRWLQRDRWV
jgi:hypothetical protein